MSACKRLIYFVKHRSLWTHVRRNVTAWSPVGAAFNAKPHRRLDLFEKSVVSICSNVFVFGYDTYTLTNTADTNKDLHKVVVVVMAFLVCVCLWFAGFVWSTRAELSCRLPGCHKDSSEKHWASVGKSLCQSSRGWDRRVFWPALRWFM